MAESDKTIDEVQDVDDLDLNAFAKRHDLAIGEARQIIQDAGCDRTTADRLAHRRKKW